MQLVSIRRARSRKNSGSVPNQRQRLLFVSFFGILVLILVRLGYWQLVKASELSLEADNQYQRIQKQSGERGGILFQDKKPMVLNRTVYRLYAQPAELQAEDREKIIATLSDFVQKRNPDNEDLVEATKLSLLELLDSDQRKWASLLTDLTEADRAELASYDLPHTGFEPYPERFYPEASSSAHLTGFVGKNEAGEDVGYFGLEGALDTELRPRSFSKKVVTDALGYAVSPDSTETNLDGRTFTTTIRRDVQMLIERKLREGMLRYGPEIGEVIVLDPTTGNLLGMAVEPTYDQRDFAEADPKVFANPSLATVYEPGSTFKVLTVSAGIDAGVITPDTTCDRCGGPRQFGQYTIKTWNEEYHPNISMSDALAKSDNVAMIFVAERLGPEKLRTYLKNFGIGDPIGIDLEEDTGTPFPETFHAVELATASFGQGISTNSFQLVRAVATIANQGVMMQPKVLQAIYDPITDTTIEVEPKEVRRVVSIATAQQVTQMMVYSAQHGEAQWTYRPNHTVAGKTGTSQVAIKGGYDESKTIASFVGFAPAQKPAFVMLVKLTAPSSSIWAAETAAPLWYDIAEELYLLLQIPPDR